MDISKSNFKSCLIFGATSSIAIQLSSILIANGFQLSLVGRSLTKMNAILENLKGNHRNISTLANIDFSESPEAYIHKIELLLSRNKYTHIFINHGVMFSHSKLSNENIFNEFNCNLTSIAVLLNLIESYASQIDLKQIIVVGSIAGDMGKEKNPCYDATKAGLHTLCEGFAERFYGLGVDLLLIKPGNISSPMTDIAREGILWATPSYVAHQIFKNFDSTKRVIYVPIYWGWIMTLVKMIPMPLFRFLGLGKSNT